MQDITMHDRQDTYREEQAPLSSATVSNGSDVALLNIKQLRVDFTGRQGLRSAVRGISLEIRVGEIVALVGQSGSGKSVTAAAITQLLPHAHTKVSGVIEFDGKNLLTLSEHDLEQVRGRGIAMVFQNPLSALDPSFTIGSQLSETLRHRHDRATSRTNEAILEEAASWLKRVGIHEPERVLTAYPHQLSGGMRQRVMIAMAVSNRPRLLIADEPTTALDATLQKEILALIKRLSRELSMAVLMITHDFGVVSYLCDRVAVMNAGRIVEEGNTRALLSAPTHPYTRQLIDAVPEMGRRLLDPSPSRRLGAMVESWAVAAPLIAANQMTTSDAPVILEVRNLSKTFQVDTGAGGKERAAFAAVSDVGLDIRRGEIFGIIGPSGSGKSTLARLIAHLIEPSAGTVRFDGDEVNVLGRAALRAFRRRFQFVFQDSTSALNPRRTIAEQLCDPALRLGAASNHTDAMALAVEALERVGLSAADLARYPHVFSGGQRQRIGIARALVVKPDFIVLDEPTSALDVAIQGQILNLLLELRESLNLTYLFIGHSLPVIEFLCDRVAVMEHGRIIETFNAISLHAHAKHPSTWKLLDAILPVRSEQEVVEAVAVA